MMIWCATPISTSTIMGKSRCFRRPRHGFGHRRISGKPRTHPTHASDGCPLVRFSWFHAILTCSQYLPGGSGGGERPRQPLTSPREARRTRFVGSRWVSRRASLQPPSQGTPGAGSGLVFCRASPPVSPWTRQRSATHIALVYEPERPWWQAVTETLRGPLVTDTRRCTAETPASPC